MSRKLPTRSCVLIALIFLILLFNAVKRINFEAVVEEKLLELGGAQCTLTCIRYIMLRLLHTLVYTLYIQDTRKDMVEDGEQNTLSLNTRNSTRHERMQVLICKDRAPEWSKMSVVRQCRIPHSCTQTNSCDAGTNEVHSTTGMFSARGLAGWLQWCCWHVHGDHDLL